MWIFGKDAFSLISSWSWDLDNTKFFSADSLDKHRTIGFKWVMVTKLTPQQEIKKIESVATVLEEADSIT